MFPHILAQQLFFLRLKILLLHHGAVIMLRHQRLGLPETDPGDAAHGQAGFLRRYFEPPASDIAFLQLPGGKSRHRHLRHARFFGGRLLQQFQFRGTCLLETGKRRLDHPLLHLHDFLKTFDIAHLKVHPRILVQMPGSIVLLRPKHRPHLINPLKDPHHHLLVKLGTLGQISLSAEIVQRKDIGPSLCSRFHDLGRMYLGKMLFLQKAAESLTKPFLDFKDGPLLFIAQGQHPIIQQIFQGGVHFLLIDNDGHGLRRDRQHLQFQQPQFPAQPGTFLRSHQRPDPDTALLHQFFHPKTGEFRTVHALDHMPACAQQHKGKSAHAPQLIDTALEQNFLSRLLPDLFQIEAGYPDRCPGCFLCGFGYQAVCHREFCYFVLHGFVHTLSAILSFFNKFKYHKKTSPTSVISYQCGTGLPGPSPV